MSLPNTRVNGFMRHESRWKAEFEKLREICLASDLTEEFKWMHPCYTVEDKNVVLIHGFKDYFGLAFFKGAIMKDPKKLLVQQTKNVQATRQLRFTSLQEVLAKESTIKSYIREAMKIEKAGLEVPMKKTEEFEMPEEFEVKLKKSATLRKAFEALTPGRQRGYLLYFSAAKQSKTRESRIEKCIPQILKGRGLDDK